MVHSTIAKTPQSLPCAQVAATLLAMDTTASEFSASTLAALSRLPPDASTRVVVSVLEDVVASPEPMPGDFATSVAYRTALIERHRKAQQPGRSRLEEVAATLGLILQPASTLNAIAVEGPAAQILSLLDQVPVRQVVLDRQLHRD